MEIEKTKTTFMISVLKIVYFVVLVFSISNFFTNKNSQGRKLNAKQIPSSGNSALVAWVNAHQPNCKSYQTARIWNLLVGQSDEFSQTNYYLTLSYFKESPK